mgnify:CR=1 FL=1
MSPEAQRIAIAEACGWEHIAFKRGWIKAGDGETQGVIPDYLADLNACNEMEQVLTLGEREEFKNILEVVCAGTPQWDRISATAAQRAKAFLRTIGKWKDAK